MPGKECTPPVFESPGRLVMAKREIKDIAESIKAKLKNISRDTNRTEQLNKSLPKINKKHGKTLENLAR